MKPLNLKILLWFVLSVIALFALSCGGQPASTSSSSTTSKPNLSVSSTASSSTTSTTTTTTPTTTQTTLSSTSSKTTNVSSSTVTTSKSLSWSTPPAMQIDKNKTYTATLNTTLGSFKIKLFAADAPNTSNNFVFLSRQGYYNNVIFHRIMKTFMIQTGDPTGTGRGSPGYKFADELPPKRSYDPGIVAMANSGPNTNGSQFFICTGADAARSLNTNPKYTQFGQVIEGMEIVQKIASVQVKASERGELSKPVDPPVIKSIEISETE